MPITGKDKFSHFPQHIAIIMDGNRRWAEQRGLSHLEGHRAGADSLRRVIEYLGGYRLPYLTVYGFSTENWRRSKTEVDGLFMLVEHILGQKLDEMHRNGIKLRHLGCLEELPDSVQKIIRHSVVVTKDNMNMTLGFAFNYGGRAEILNAVCSMIADGTPQEKINESTMGQYLYTGGMPDVDLVIRTGGETRLSNFLIWQTVYSEIYFSDVLWPDFDAAELDKALTFYSGKQRRFGGD
jgi:undecaprenyl diphosphate synthase